MSAFTPFVYRCTFRGWYDGDSPTLDIDLGFRTIMHDQKVRLYGVNTPEIRGEERPRGLIVRDLVNLWAPLATPGIIRTHKDKTGKFGSVAGRGLPGRLDRKREPAAHARGSGRDRGLHRRRIPRIEAMWA